MRKRKLVCSGVVILTMLFLGISVAFSLTPIQERVSWRYAELYARFKYALSPPEDTVFLPQEGAVLSQNIVPSASLATPPLADKSRLSTPSATPPSLPTPAQTPTLIPQNIGLAGFRHEYQTWNNCGPATLGMALSFWGWDGNQRPIAAFTKPNPRDKNVMPYELAAYVEEETQLEVVFRAGGEIELLKRFLAAGLPVMIEKGFEGPGLEGWMGHYVLVTGYSNQDQSFRLQDSFYGPDQAMEYADLESNWRAFNFTYLVVYPDERRGEVAAILGPDADEDYNGRHAAEKASEDIYTLAGRDQFFAWFNRGTSLVQLRDYAAAAAAYDQAFAVYPSIPKNQRPWRMMWYQTGPYWAYYYAGRYQDVIELATTTLNAMSEPVLEESYYWRALAREALGETEAGIGDLRQSLKYHPGFEPALTELQRLNVDP